MPLGPHVDEWRALAEVLAAVAERTGARNAFVVDAWGHLWCRARALGLHEQDEVLALARRALDRAARPLARGGRLDHTEIEEAGGWYARSFADVYAVLVAFDGPIDELAVRRVTRERLAEIEALTLALPPPEGPDATEAAKRRG